MGLLPFGGVPPKTNVAGTGISVVNSGSTSTIGILNAVQSTIQPTVQTFLSGSGTYTTPSNPAPLYIKVRMVGGGGGGGGSNNASGSTAGGNTTFGSALTTNGGSPGSASSGGAGGTVSTSAGPIILAALAGGSGGGTGQDTTGMYTTASPGASTPFGGAGGACNNASNGKPAVANTGSGGGGGSDIASSGQNAGGGGGAGGYIEAIITSPTTSYAYSIGAGGAGASGGTYAGGAGGSGVVIVEEYYGTIGPAVTAQVSYAQAYSTSASTWSTTSATFADPTNGGGNAITVRRSSGIALTAAASSLPGITFTPASSNAIYQITATFPGSGKTAGAIAAYRLYDGTTELARTSNESTSAVPSNYSNTLNAVYVPGTTSPITVKIQLAAIGGGTTEIVDYSGISSSVEWTVTRIDSLAVTGGSGITRSVNSVSTNTSAGAAASTDYVYLVSGTTTLTLPTAVGNTNLYTVKNTGVAVVRIATTSAQTIDGSASPITLPVANTSLDLISDGANWRIL